MLLTRLLAYFRRSPRAPRLTEFQAMREALKPERVAALPPKPAARVIIRKRS
jgi:hypothetical protein